jgi:hypothetical protein
MASKNDVRLWLEVLGLAPGASKQELDDAYRDLVKVWHPDRFQNDPTLRLKAQEKLRDLNAAYEGLRRSGIPPREPAPAPAPPAWNKATPETRSARWGLVWGFGAVLVATAAVVAIVLSIGMRRDTVTPTDVVLAPAPPPRKAAREPQRIEPPAPAAGPTVGALMVLSEPSGATVYVNDQQVGHTPLTLPSLAPGGYRVRVELGNYPSWSSPVQIEAGASEKLIAFMERRALP